MLAGMNVAAGPKLAAAVSNAGGIGVIGGVGYTPDMLREQIAELKGFLKDKSAPFGVDLLLPQVGGSARKTNYDYTKGKLDELIGIIIDSGAKLFVSAVGVPPKAVVERLQRWTTNVRDLVTWEAGSSSAVHIPLHADEWVLAEPGGIVVCAAQSPPAASR